MPDSPLKGDALAYVEALFGGCVPEADETGAELMHRIETGETVIDHWRVGVGRPAWVTWTLSIALPSGVKHPPVLLSPDGCWPHAISVDAFRAAREAGIALAWFNRVELAHDAPDACRRGPVFDRWPEARFGAIAVWAWGIRRAVDALIRTGHARPGRIGVTGHSRGGKAALLATAMDTRIKACISHNSGTGGAASLQELGPGSETLEDLASRFPHWVGPDMLLPEVRQHLRELDSLALLRTLAPRGLCVLQADEDLWANPLGTRHNIEQLRPMWDAQGAADALQWIPRPGGHPMGAADWTNAAAFTRRMCGNTSD